LAIADFDEYPSQDRSGPVQKAEIHAYVEKAKAGKLSSLIKQHVFSDFVSIRTGDGDKVGRLPC
jgi:hypothetical protein